MSRVSRGVALGQSPELSSAVNAMSVNAAVTAAGTVITDATDLAAEHNTLTTVGASTGVQLPDWPIGSIIFVKNAGANTVNVFPHSATGDIYTASTGAGAGTAVTIASAKKGRFVRLTSVIWDYTLEN
jgi:hypothetical protein